MSPFAPVGDQARWRALYDLLVTTSVDSIVTYDQLGAAVSLDPDADRHAIQMALRRAAQEFEEADKHALVAVPNVGYRVVEAQEHLTLAKDQQRRASRALVRGHSKVVNVDLAGVDPEVRNAFQVVAQAFSMQMEMSRRLDARQSNLEQVVRAVTAKQERSDEEVADLKARLARLESERQSQ